VRFGITKHALGFVGFVEMSREEFDAAKAAREMSFEILYLEEKFDLLIGNYLDYESTLLSAAARHMIYKEFDFSSFQDEIYLVARRIVNLLTTCRLYVDQTTHHLKQIYGTNSTQLLAFNAELSSQYDSSMGFRAMEA